MVNGIVAGGERESIAQSALGMLNCNEHCLAALAEFNSFITCHIVNMSCNFVLCLESAFRLEIFESAKCSLFLLQLVNLLALPLSYGPKDSLSPVKMKVFRRVERFQTPCWALP